MAIRLLILGDDPPALQRLVPLLRRLDFDITRARSAGEAEALARESAYDLLVARYPFAKGTLSSLVGSVRAPGSESRNGSFLLLCEPAHAPEVGRFLGRGVNTIVSPDAPTRRLVNVIATLLSVSPRRTLRALVHLDLLLHHGRRSLETETVNLSSTGMLLRTVPDLNVGERARFELRAGPMEPITGEVEIVRRTDEDREGVDGLGARIVAFDGNGGRRLAALLEELGSDAPEL